MSTFAQLERRGKELKSEELIEALKEYAENGKEIPKSAIRIIEWQIGLTRGQKVEVACLMSEAITAQEHKSSAEAKSYRSVLAALF